MRKTAGVRQNDLMEWNRLPITGNSYSNHKDIRFAGLFVLSKRRKYLINVGKNIE